LVARVAMQRDDVELVAVNDPFISIDYMVNGLLITSKFVCLLMFNFSYSNYLYISFNKNYI